MIHESDVRHKLAAVASGALPLADFAEWIDDHSWNMHSGSSPGAIDLVSSIHMLLSERDDRVIDDEALRREFVTLLNNVRVAVRAAEQWASTAYWVNLRQQWVLPASA